LHSQFSPSLCLAILWEGRIAGVLCERERLRNELETCVSPLAAGMFEKGAEIGKLLRFGLSKLLYLEKHFHNGRLCFSSIFPYAPPFSIIILLKFASFAYSAL